MAPRQSPSLRWGRGVEPRCFEVNCTGSAVADRCKVKTWRSSLQQGKAVTTIEPSTTKLAQLLQSRLSLVRAPVQEHSSDIPQGATTPSLPKILHENHLTNAKATAEPQPDARSIPLKAAHAHDASHAFYRLCRLVLSSLLPQLLPLLLFEFKSPCWFDAARYSKRPGYSVDN